MQTEVSIPQDITFQIFSWLPIKSLMRFKCVSKFCNSLVSAPDFANLHSRHSYKNILGDTKLIARVKDDCYSIDILDEDGKASIHPTENFNKLYDHINGPMDQTRFAYTDGLFCVWDESSYIVLYNPTTRQVRPLPLLDMKDFSHPTTICSIGFEPEENRYKVLLMVNIYCEESRAWVFTIGIDESWREIKSITGYLNISQYKHAICINGIIYQFSYDKNDRVYIVEFDVKSETFKIITLPYPYYFSSDYDHILIEVKGKIGIVDFTYWWNNKQMIIVVPGETQQKEWEHEFLRFPLEWEDKYISMVHHCRVCQINHEEVVFGDLYDDGFVCLCYNVNKKSWRKCEVPGAPNADDYYVESICAYDESLFPLQNIGTTRHLV